MAGLSDALDPWTASLTGKGPPQSPPPPGMGPWLPDAATTFTGALRNLGMGDYTSRQLGRLAPYTPFGQAFEGGQSLARGWDEGDPLGAAVGAGQIGLSMLPAFGPRPAPRPPSLSFTADDVAHWLSQNGAVNVDPRVQGAWATNYVNFHAPGALSRRERYTVRVSGDMHAAHMERRNDPRLLDTGSTYGGAPVRTPSNYSPAGQPYSDWDVLTGELRRILDANKPTPPGPLAGTGATTSLSR